MAWFVGGGVENNLNIFGISAPGWFMKTEYRAAYYDRKDVARDLRSRRWRGRRHGRYLQPWTQTISTSLVYRFNWGGAPVAARY
jgi:outer membrane immunogenic protein